jgi:serine/threonine protein kinase
MLQGDERDTGEVRDDTGTGVLDAPPRWAEPEGVELDWQPGRDLGRYVILQTLGRGGMGVVLRAYDKELDRAVALKVLHPSDDELPNGTLGHDARLLREAQAMARLSHPNVVGVHDVVVLEKRVCMVMELVEGTTAREWLKQPPKPAWREILRVFRAAAVGLGAAHRAKLIHRDFKPDNVMVGNDGRIRVTDFGIARLAEPGAPVARTPPSSPDGLAAQDPNGLSQTDGPGGSPTTGASPSSPGTPGSGASLQASITQDGQVVGTPRYMAPEQFAGMRADFRTDQFSFAVTLYEALYGQLPFAGNSAAARLQHAKKGEVLPPPASSPVPQWIHRVLVRALSSDPSRRWESMEALDEALGKDPTVRRNRVLAGAALVLAALLAVGAVIHAGRSRAQLCTGSERMLAGIWDPARREKIHAAFTATGLPFAEDSFNLAAGVLDHYTEEWVKDRREACEATSVRGEQTPQVLTLRMTCLQQRLEAVSTITELFTRADPGVVGRSKQALDGLPRLTSCSDVARLTARVPPPEDPKVAEEVERIRKSLTRVQMLLDAGQRDAAQAALKPALASAEKTGYPPVQAGAELAMGRVLQAKGEFAQATPYAQSALRRALAEGDDESITSATMLLGSIAYRLHQDERALEWIDYCEAANARTKDPQRAVLILNDRGNVVRNEGDFEKASSYFARAAEQARKLLGPDDMITLGTSYNHASALQNLGHFREASEEYRFVITNARRVLGPKHPFLAFPLVGSALVARYRDDFDQAKRNYREVLVLTQGKGLNADNAWFGLGDIAQEEGHYDEAVEDFDKGIAVDDAMNPGGPETLEMQGMKGRVLAQMGRTAEAWKLLESVLAHGAKLKDAFDAVADAELGEAEILLGRHQAARALPKAEHAVALLTPTRGKAHPSTLDARMWVAELKHALGRQSEASADARAVLADARVELPESAPQIQRARALLAQDAADNDVSTVRGSTGMDVQQTINPHEPLQ